MSSKIGRFELLSELSRSANGVVYKANDPSAARTVVLKTLKVDLPPDLAKLLIEIILREAESTKVLNSQNIALLYGAGEIDDTFCAAMEYVEGNSLAAMVARKEGFSIWDLLDIGRQVCNALDHADTRAVLHRGLEPEKIMMQWDGTVKILGYGISTLVSATPKKGAVPPLFYYMSPEQIKGEHMDVRSNIFSWGAILYEMVTDQKPFTGDDIETVRRKILEETPEPPASINPRINLGVSNVIMQALAKSPEERYQHGHELMLDLDRAKEPVAKQAQAGAPASGLIKPQKIKAQASEKVTVAAKSVAKGAPQATVAPEPPTPLKKAAAAAASAGAGGTVGSAASVPSGNESAPGPRMSAATAAPEKPKFAIDPMMAENAGPGKKAASFSDLEEMPPLKEMQFAPEPAPAPVAEDAPMAPQATFALRPRTIKPAKEEKPKVITRENAKKAVAEIKQVPPRLIAYAVAGAAAFILLIVVGIWFHIRNENADVAPVPEEVQTTTQQPPAPARQAMANPEAAAVPEQSPATEPEVTVTPQYPREVRSQKKGKAKARTPVQPVILPGQLTVTSVPEGAQVQVDGRTDAGWVTPYTVSGLKPGAHTIALAKAGFGSETRTITVSSGAKSAVEVRLAQLGATLVVASDPSGAAIYVDGKNIGRMTPARISFSERGSHTILVRKEGYLDETTTTVLTPGETFNYAPNLRALGVTDDIKVVGKFNKLFGKKGAPGMSKISVKTQPKGAQVTANRHMVEKPTPVDFLLNPGNYVIDISLPGYKTIHRVINVEEGSKVELNENLEPE